MCLKHETETRLIVEKIEKIEVHQLPFSYQMADEQLRRNDDCP